MKRREMDSLSRSLGEYLSSRNNDIAGYWGIGMLCAASKREGKAKFSFKIYPGRLIRIYGCEITNSKLVTDKLIQFGLDSIEGRLSFFEDGRYPHGAEKYTCGIAIAITQGGRTGLSLSNVECWPHDRFRERRRAGFVAAEGSWITRLKNLLNFGRA
ncbi:MAG TPA: hypothetical protein VFE58_15685 [Tepidisphaeraceae bacterium]|jgi:hypothetical protein|nr:hypothetical protein [Tepidisphaeraceae bacterium]